MTGDRRTYIRLHDGMPDHPKIVGLSDAAFRLYVEALCWCSRHLTDGALPDAALRKLGGAKARREIVAAGLVKEGGDGWMIHDYLEHQRSAAEVEERVAARQDGARRTNHERWHVRRNRPDQSCPFCVALISQERSQERSVTNTRDRDRESDSKNHSGGTRKRAAQVPNDFTIDDGMRAWAAQNVPRVDLERETAKFLDWARAKGEVKKDWTAAWRNWVRRADENLTSRNGHPQPKRDHLPEALR